MSDQGAHNLNETSRGSLFRMCTEVSELCPVERTVLSYYPNFGANLFFAITFGLLVLLSGGLGVWKRTWTFTVAVTGGTILETVGYVGRVMLNANPWDSDAFQMQICAIILGPTFICVGVYLTLKHVTLNLNPRLSRIPSRLYPWIFLPADMSCLIVQAIGGALAAAAGQTNRTLLNGGNRAIIAGVALQVVVLLIFGVLGVDYWVRIRRWVHAVEAEGQSATEAEGEDADIKQQSVALYRDKKFRRFACAIAGAFSAILLRCIYRIAEMAGGWGNHIMQDEVSFMILDSGLIFVAVTLLTAFHPGLYFPKMATGAKPKKEENDTEVGAVTGGETTPEPTEKHISKETTVL